MEKKKYHGGFQWSYVAEIIDGEIWKTSVLPTGTVDLSNVGRVRSNGIGSENYGSCCHGYMVVEVGGKHYRINRLICEAFNGSPPSPKHVANHIDENTLNNRADNLNWMTQRENTEYLTGYAVTQYTSDGTVIAEYVSIMRASEVTGIRPHIIHNSCKLKGKSLITSFIFRYSEEGFSAIKTQKRIIKGTEIIQMSLDGKEIERFHSTRAATRKFKAHRTIFARHIANDIEFA